MIKVFFENYFRFTEIKFAQISRLKNPDVTPSRRTKQLKRCFCKHVQFVEMNNVQTLAWENNKETMQCLNIWNYMYM